MFLHVFSQLAVGFSMFWDEQGKWETAVTLRLYVINQSNELYKKPVDEKDDEPKEAPKLTRLGKMFEKGNLAGEACVAGIRTIPSVIDRPILPSLHSPPSRPGVVQTIPPTNPIIAPFSKAWSTISVRSSTDQSDHSSILLPPGLE